MKNNLKQLSNIEIKNVEQFFSGLIRYWHNPFDKDPDQIFTIPDKDTMVNEMKKVIRRLKNLSDDIDSDVEKISDEGDNFPLAKLAQQSTETSDN